jgi:hypothetical protein
MAEKIFKEQFCDIQKIKVCTTSSELNFDHYTTCGTYEIYEDMGGNQSRVYFLAVDKSAYGACVTQTRVYCGKVEERHTTATGTWTNWTATTGSGGSGATCPGSMRIEYRPGTLIDLAAVVEAYNNGTYIYLVGEHSFMFDWYSDVINEYIPTMETGRFAIPLVVVELDTWTNTVSLLYFGGSDNLGNGVSLYVGGDGMTNDLDINLDCKYLPGGVDGGHNYATMEQVETAINEALGVIENGAY